MSTEIQLAKDDDKVAEVRRQIAAMPYQCPGHEVRFPNESPWRPLSEWVHDPLTGEPRWGCCRRCTQICARVRAVHEHRQQELETLIGEERGESPEADGIRKHLAYLETLEPTLAAS